MIKKKLSLATVIAILAIGFSAGMAEATTRPPNPDTRLVPFGASPRAGLTHIIGQPRSSARVNLVFALKEQPVAHTHPLAADVKAVRSWLASEGFHASLRGSLLSLALTVRETSKLLHVKFYNCRSYGVTFYASTIPYVPSDLKHCLADIAGLNGELLDAPGFVGNPAISSTVHPD